MGQRHTLPGFRWLSCATQPWKCFLGLPTGPTQIQLDMYGITSDDIWRKWIRVYNHWKSCEKRSMRCGIIFHSSMSDVWFSVCGGKWQQLLRQMVAPHITDCNSVIIVKFLIVIYTFLSLYMFTQINKLIAEVIVRTNLVFTFCLIACVTVSAIQKVEISGPWGWVLWKTTITHQACPFLSNFAENSQNTYFITLPILMVELNL